MPRIKEESQFFLNLFSLNKNFALQLQFVVFLGAELLADFFFFRSLLLELRVLLLDFFDLFWIHCDGHPAFHLLVPNEFEVLDLLFEESELLCLKLPLISVELLLNDPIAVRCAQLPKRLLSGDPVEELRVGSIKDVEPLDKPLEATVVVHAKQSEKLLALVDHVLALHLHDFVSRALL